MYQHLLRSNHTVQKWFWKQDEHGSLLEIHNPATQYKNLEDLTPQGTGDYMQFMGEMSWTGMNTLHPQWVEDQNKDLLKPLHKTTRSRYDNLFTAK
jgi:hypothetical protein